jgi:hypothetical protein
MKICSNQKYCNWVSYYEMEGSIRGHSIKHFSHKIESDQYNAKPSMLNVPTGVVTNYFVKHITGSIPIELF